MQLYALDQSSLVLASHARRRQGYTCPECLGSVYCRGGQRRQFHFYHIRRPAFCRQHGKSLAHLQIQLHLKSLIPDLSLEKRVENRIADTLWEKEKIVFEIQCSPMSLDEAKERTDDYRRKGYTPVWILHDRRFNQKRLTPMEEYVRSHTTAFFTDGRHFYDQFDVCRDSRRLFRSSKLIVDLTKPHHGQQLTFQGDFTHWSKTHDTSHLKKIAKRYRKHRWKLFYKFLIYRILDSVTI